MCNARVTVNFTPNATAAHVGLNGSLGGRVIGGSTFGAIVQLLSDDAKRVRAVCADYALKTEIQADEESHRHCGHDCNLARTDAPPQYRKTDEPTEKPQDFPHVAIRHAISHNCLRARVELFDWLFDVTASLPCLQ